MIVKCEYHIVIFSTSHVPITSTKNDLQNDHFLLFKQNSTHRLASNDYINLLCTTSSLFFSSINPLPRPPSTSAESNSKHPPNPSSPPNRQNTSTHHQHCNPTHHSPPPIMCYKLIEKPTCGHNSSHTIPCEGSLVHEKCDAPPEACQDKTNKLDEACRNCKADEDEEAALAHALKQIAEDPALAAEPKSVVQQADGKFGFFKQRTRWSFCGRMLIFPPFSPFPFPLLLCRKSFPLLTSGCYIG